MGIIKCLHITACKRHNPAAGATQGYDRLHAKRYGQVLIIISFYMSKLLQNYLLKLLNLRLKMSVEI